MAPRLPIIRDANRAPVRFQPLLNPLRKLDDSPGSSAWRGSTFRSVDGKLVAKIVPDCPKPRADAIAHAWLRAVEVGIRTPRLVQVLPGIGPDEHIFVSEYIPGAMDLVRFWGSARATRDGKASVRSQAQAALEAVHQLGAQFAGDIQPSNFVVDPQTHVYVLGWENVTTFEDDEQALRAVFASLDVFPTVRSARRVASKFASPQGSGRARTLSSSRSAAKPPPRT